MSTIIHININNLNLNFSSKRNGRIFRYILFHWKALLTLSFQKVYLRDLPPQSTAKVSYQWDIPIVMQAEDKLNFSNTKPTVWLRKENDLRNLTIPDIADGDNFIIINPEEIGMQISHLRVKSLYMHI